MNVYFGIKKLATFKEMLICVREFCESTITETKNQQTEQILLAYSLHLYNGDEYWEKFANFL